MVRSLKAGLTAAALGAAASASASTLQVYPPPPVPEIYAYHNDDFTVRVRAPGGVWRDLYEYKIRVDWDKPQDASLVYFDFTGEVEVEVQKNNGGFARVDVAPLASAIKPDRRGQIVRLRLTRPERFSLQFDDDRLHNLHILAGAPPAVIADAPNVRRFGPGVHVPPAGAKVFPVKSGETLVLDGGAILKGAFSIEDLRDVTIQGRGLMYNPGRGVDIWRSSNVRLEDFILINNDLEPAARVVNVRDADHVAILGVSGFTSGKWADGVNISTSQHVRVDRAYLRTSDDAVVVYAVADCPICTPKPDPNAPPAAGRSADTFDIKVTNSTLWTDVAHGLYVGHFGDNVLPRTIRDVTFDNIDIANLDEDDPAWEGAMAVYSGDSTLIRDITFSDIRVDRIEEGKLINIVAGYNPRYNTAPGRGVANVVLRNIRYTGDGMPSRSQIQGLSADTAVSGVRIEGLTVNGHVVRTPSQADLTLGSFVSGFNLN